MLIMIIAVMLVIAVFGVSIVALTQTSQHSELTANAGSRAHYLAESGLRYAQYVYCTVGWDVADDAPRTLKLNAGDEVEIARKVVFDEEGNIANDTFIATATAHPQTAMEARSRLFASVQSCLPYDPEPEFIDLDSLVGGSEDVVVTQGTVLDGDIILIDANVDIKGSVGGEVIAWDVKFDGQGEVIAGNVIAGGNVAITGGGEVYGDVHANADFDLGGGGIIHGNVYARGRVTIRGSTVLGEVHSCEGTVSTTGSARTGSIRASGNISIGGGSIVDGHADSGASIAVNGEITGEATAWLEITGGGVIRGGTYEGARPAAAICPDPYLIAGRELPVPTEFSAGGTDVNQSTTVPLTPGSYGKVTLGVDGQMHLRGGDYFFESIGLKTRGTLYLDLSSQDDIHVFVSETASFAGQLSVYVSTDGINYGNAFPAGIEVDSALAARVYLESHEAGKNSTAFSLGNDSGWFGSIYTPYGMLDVGNGSQLIGSYYSGGGHNLGNAAEFTHVLPDYFENQE